MCRWLVYFGESEVLLADLVTRPKNSIVQQSFADPYLPFIPCEKQRLNHKVNGDGFGFGWYDDIPGGIPCVFTSVKPSWNDLNLLRLSEHIKSKCIFAHVRAASPKSLIVETNCHPFQFGRILFMHNGCIAHFAKLKRKLILDLSEESFAMIRGTTDTEHAGALFVNYLPNRDPHAIHSIESMKEALLKTMKHLIRLTKEASDQSQASSLNFAITNGEVTIATRFRNSDEEEPPSLYYTKRFRYRSGSDLSSCKTVKSCLGGNPFQSVVISSEPLNYEEDEWDLIPKNYMMIITSCKKVLLEPLELEDEYFVKTRNKNTGIKLKNMTTPPSSPRLSKVLTPTTSRMTTISPSVSSITSKGSVKELQDICIQFKLNREFLIVFMAFLLYLCMYK